MSEKGYDYATAEFARLIANKLGNSTSSDSELKTTIAMYNLLNSIFSILDTYSGTTLHTSINLNRTEKGSGSLSCAVQSRARPDTVVVHSMSTVMIGEDKMDNMLNNAICDLKDYVKGGLGAAQYGRIPGIPAYAASGLQLQFCYITREGEVGLTQHACSPHIVAPTHAGTRA